MGPMSLTESKDSTVEVSLEALFNGEVDCFGHSECDIEDMAYLICRGGWPRAVTTSNKSAALEMASDYVTTITEQDISRADGVTRNPPICATHLTRIRKTYGLAGDTVDHPEGSQSARHRPVERYREWLSRSPEKAVCYPGTFCMDTHFARQIAHHENADSSLRLPSIAAAALGASPESLLLDTATMGLLFESLCVRDLRVYAQANNGEIFHYHDEAGHEADAVVQPRDGRYALFEMKLGTSLVDEGAKSLVRLREKIDTNAIGEPVFCAVITPGGFAMRRDDGVFVIPITCLTA